MPGALKKESGTIHPDSSMIPIKERKFLFRYESAVESVYQTHIVLCDKQRIDDIDRPVAI